MRHISCYETLTVKVGIILPPSTVAALNGQAPSDNLNPVHILFAKIQYPQNSQQSNKLFKSSTICKLLKL